MASGFRAAGWRAAAVLRRKGHSQPSSGEPHCPRRMIFPLDCCFFSSLELETSQIGSHNQILMKIQICVCLARAIDMRSAGKADGEEFGLHSMHFSINDVICDESPAGHELLALSTEQSCYFGDSYALTKAPAAIR
jgi:hypothetical protein